VAEARRIDHRAGYRGGALAVLAALAVAGAVGCGKKAGPPPGHAPELTGLAVVPANAQAVVGVDVAKLTDSQVVDRAIEQLLTHDAALAERWQRFKEACKIDLEKQIKRVIIALGPHTGLQPGTGPVLMIATGSVPETELKDCVTKLVGTGGGTVTGKAVQDRTVYLAKDGNRTMYFAYSRPDTIVLGSDEAYLTEALSSGKKAADDPELTTWRRLVNARSPLWAVGRTDPRIRDGLVQLTEGKISAGPAAFAASLDLTDGAKFQLSAVMATQEQAKNLESYAKGELALLGAAAQLKSLGALVAKLGVTVDNAVVQFQATLTVDDLNRLLSALDAASTSEQDRPPPDPAAGSGTQQ